jgi:hypothetical protein
MTSSENYIGNTLKILSTENSEDLESNAVVINGGVAVKKDLHVDGDIILKNKRLSQTVFADYFKEQKETNPIARIVSVSSGDNYLVKIYCQEDDRYDNCPITIKGSQWDEINGEWYLRYINYDEDIVNCDLWRYRDENGNLNGKLIISREGYLCGYSTGDIFYGHDLFNEKKIIDQDLCINPGKEILVNCIRERSVNEGVTIQGLNIKSCEGSKILDVGNNNLIILSQGGFFSLEQDLMVGAEKTLLSVYNESGKVCIDGCLEMTDKIIPKSSDISIGDLEHPWDKIHCNKIIADTLISKDSEFNGSVSINLKEDTFNIKYEDRSLFYSKEGKIGINTIAPVADLDINCNVNFRKSLIYSNETIEVDKNTRQINTTKMITCLRLLSKDIKLSLDCCDVVNGQVKIIVITYCKNENSCCKLLVPNFVKKHHGVVLRKVGDFIRIIYCDNSWTMIS